jgi:hypothetical protein
MSLTGFCMAERVIASWKWLGAAVTLQLAAVVGGAARAQQVPAATVAASAPAADAATWITVPRLAGRLKPADLGLVINTADSASVAVGEYYAAARGLQPHQVLRAAA